MTKKENIMNHQTNFLAGWFSWGLPLSPARRQSTSWTRLIGLMDQEVVSAALHCVLITAALAVGVLIFEKNHMHTKLQ